MAELHPKFNKKKDFPCPLHLKERSYLTKAHFHLKQRGTNILRWLRTCCSSWCQAQGDQFLVRHVDHDAKHLRRFWWAANLRVVPFAQKKGFKKRKSSYKKGGLIKNIKKHETTTCNTCSLFGFLVLSALPTLSIYWVEAQSWLLFGWQKKTHFKQLPLIKWVQQCLQKGFINIWINETALTQNSILHKKKHQWCCSCLTSINCIPQTTFNVRSKPRNSNASGWFEVFAGAFFCF